MVGGRRSQGPRKPLMLFVHGFPELWDTWWKQMQAFQDDYVVAALDMRGYGASEIPKARSDFGNPAHAHRPESHPSASAVLQALPLLARQAFCAAPS